MSEKYKIFFIMPFDTEFNDMYERVKEVIEGESSIYEVFRADNLINQQNILKDIVVSINESDLIIADLTDLNANVFYELGLAHALRKNVILLTQQLSDLPFDLRSYRVISYSNHFKRIEELETSLKKMLKDIQDGKMSFGSPITDWIPLTSNNDTTLSSNDSFQRITSVDKTVEIIEDEIIEEGLIDFMADIEESMGDLVSTIGNITDGTLKLNEVVVLNTEEINKANQNGGNGTVSRVRKIARKISLSMNEYGIFLASQNKEYNKHWDKFERSTTNLFNTDILLKEVEKDDKEFVVFINELNLLKEHFHPTKDIIETMVEAVRGVRGLESSITRASVVIERELKELIDLLDKSIAATDRLTNRGRYIIRNQGKLI